MLDQNPLDTNIISSQLIDSLPIGATAPFLRQNNRSDLVSSSIHTFSTVNTAGNHYKSDRVNYITFNQDASCIALGLRNGYRIFRCSPQFSLGFSFHHNESIGIVEMLYSSSLIAIVAMGDEPGSSPRKLVLLNSKRLTTICDLVFPSTILQVKLTGSRLVVLLEDEIYMYHTSTMDLVHTVETSPNIGGLCAILSLPLTGASNLSKSFLAYPSPPKTIVHDSLLAAGINTNGGTNSATNNVSSVSNAPNRIGDVIVFDLELLQPVCVIEAHKSAIAAMSLSPDGSLLATASEKGTIVRVFSVESGVKLYQFRRGTYSTRIYSLSFSSSNDYVLATSSSGTVHIFRLGMEEGLTNKQFLKQNDEPLVSSIVEEDEGSMKNILDEEDDSDAINDSDIDPDDEEQSGTEDVEDSMPSQPQVTMNSSSFANVSLSAATLGNVDLATTLSPSPLSAQSTANISPICAKGEPASSSLLTPAAAINAPLVEPMVDRNRLLVARLIRRLSQKLGRKAAQKMGDFLPLRFSLILEPTRHFASLKINSTSKDVRAIAHMKSELEVDQVPLQFFNRDHDHKQMTPTIDIHLPQDLKTCKLLHIHLVTSDGMFYIYGLDPQRGGDCILLSQRSLLDGDW